MSPATTGRKRSSLANQFDSAPPRGAGLAGIFKTGNSPSGPARQDSVLGGSTPTTEHALAKPVEPESVEQSTPIDATPTPEADHDLRPSREPAQAHTGSDTATTSPEVPDSISTEPAAPTIVNDPSRSPAASATIVNDPSRSPAASANEDVRPTAVYVPAAVKDAWKTRSQREKKSYGEIVEDAFAEHTPETLVRLFAPKPVENSIGGMPRRTRPKAATGGVEVRPHLVVAQTEWIDQQVGSSPLIPSRSALIAAVVEAYVTR